MLQFEPEFFEAETRDGFYIEPLVKNAWAAQLETLALFDRICEENNLTYSADWGTLLGAVRHGGFIPWDDDLDVCMPREDLMRFYEIIENYPELECRNPYNDPNLGIHATRLNLSMEFTVDRDRLKDYHGFPFPAGIDIFSIDYVPRDKDAEEEQKDIMLKTNYVAHLLDLMSEHDEKEEGYYKKYKEYVREIKEKTNVEFSKNEPDKHEIMILYDEVESAYSKEDADFVSELHCLLMGGSYYLPKDSYENIIRIPFENIMICVPANYNEVLRVKYGNDYMTPRNVGGAHDYPFFKQEIQTSWQPTDEESYNDVKKHIEKISSDYYRDFLNRSSKCYVDIEEDVLDRHPINRTQAALLETLYEVDRICKKHNVNYYYVGETKEEIERIREFNSDSTDIHIAMFRDDYMNFQQFIQEDLDVWFDYRSIYTHPEHTDMRMYVITDAYGTQEGEYEARFHGCNDIVGIDIAPIDTVSNDDSVEELKSNIISKLVQSIPSMPTQPPYDIPTMALVSQWQDLLQMEINMQGNLQNALMKAADSVAMSDANDSYKRVRISSDIAENNYRLYDKSEFKRRND